MQSQSTGGEKMTQKPSLDSVLKSSLSAATSHAPVEGERLADARADVLGGGLRGTLDRTADRFTPGPAADSDDARLSRALRALAARYQATQATSPQVAAAAVPSAPLAPPVVALPAAPSAAPAVSAPAAGGASSDAGGGNRQPKSRS